MSPSSDPSSPAANSSAAFAVWLLAASLLLASCGGGADSATGDAGPAADAGGEPARAVAKRSVTVSVLEMAPQTVVDHAVLSADLRPVRRAVLAAEVAGVVDVRRVEEGERVKAGELLLEIDTRGLRQRLAEAEAVDRQRRAQLERASALLERRSITQAQYLDALTARDVAAAQLASASLELEKSKLLAPWAGRVAAVEVEEGDYARPGEPLVELLDDSRLEAWAAAPEGDVPHLRVGLPAEVRIDAFPDEVFEGRLVRLGAELDAASRTLDVVASIDNPGGLLRPGLSGRLRLPRRQLEDVYLAPLDAVIEMGDRRAVYVAADGVAEQRTVRLGPVVGADRVVIEEGLEAGDRLIVSGQRRVSPGQPIVAE